MIIAVSPPTLLAERLAVENGLKPSTLHLTLAFLGKTEDFNMGDMPAVAEAIRLAAPKKPIHCKITQQSRFQNVFMTTDADGKMRQATYPTDVIFLDIESEELYSFRQRLVEKLDDYGIYYSKLHKEFKAHMSLIYVPHGDNISLPYELPLEFEAENIEVWGEGASLLFSYPLGQRQIVVGL